MRLETLMVASEMNMKEHLDKAVIKSGKKIRTGIVAGRREYYKCKLGIGGCEKNKEIKHKQL